MTAPSGRERSGSPPRSSWAKRRICQLLSVPAKVTHSGPGWESNSATSSRRAHVL